MLAIVCNWFRKLTKFHTIANIVHFLKLTSFIQTISIAPLKVLYYSEALPTQHGYCAGISRRSATGNCRLRTCPRVGFEPTTLRLKGINSANAQPCPITSQKQIHAARYSTAQSRLTGWFCWSGLCFRWFSFPGPLKEEAGMSGRALDSSR